MIGLDLARLQAFEKLAILVTRFRALLRYAACGFTSILGPDRQIQSYQKWKTCPFDTTKHRLILWFDPEWIAPRESEQSLASTLESFFLLDISKKPKLQAASWQTTLLTQCDTRYSDC